MSNSENSTSLVEDARCRYCGGIIERGGNGASWVNIAGDRFCSFTPAGATERHHLPA